MRESNIFRLEGLETVSTSYRLFDVLSPLEKGSEYYAGITRLQRRLSREHQAPFAVLQRDETMLLAVPQNVSENLVEHHNMGRWVATLKPLDDAIEIDCSVNGDDLDVIRLRFLNFLLQSPLYHNGELWQPRAGDAFYSRKPAESSDGVDLFHGVSLRAVPYPGEGFGIMLDARTKLISKRPLGAYADENVIRRMKNSACLYRMGDLWYEIKVTGANQTVSDPILFEDGVPVTLKEYLHKTVRRPIPKSLIDLKGDGAVVTYRGSESAQVKAAPAELCFPVLDTHSKKGARLQRRTILPPHIRRSIVQRFKQKYLSTIKFGNATLSVADYPAPLEQPAITLPDLMFGADKKLFGTDRSGESIEARQYAKKRRSLIEQSDIGFFESSPLEPQTLVLPQSVMNAWGPTFVSEFVTEVRRLYPKGGYDPKVIAFNDLSGTVSSHTQAAAILKLATDGQLSYGDCAIMIHGYRGRARSQDQLPALLINQLRKNHGVNAAVFHATVPGNSYHRENTASGAHYVRKRGDRGRFSGYLTGAALNKVLLPNGKWPFVLSDALHADIVVGIDVKHHTAALVLIADGGRIIRHTLKTSTKNEKLPAGIVELKLLELLRSEAPYLPLLPRSIVVHRDGRIWPTEIAGLNSACRKLAEEGLVADDFKLSVFEIAKSSPAPLRIYKVAHIPGQENRVGNPEMGEWMKLSDEEGYVCTTGAPLLPAGTARPLHVKRATGNMPIEEALGDVFRLSCLTWTRPESCSRLPISLKLCDTLLMDEGSEHDEDHILHANDDNEAESA